MKQHQITRATELLSSRGELTEPGYARHLYYEYNPQKLKAPPFSLKEWDFYQISDTQKVLQLTIGHTSYATSVSANLFFIDSGRKLTCGITKPFSISMELNGETAHTLEYSKRGFAMKFIVEDDRRLLTLNADDKEYGEVNIHIELYNCAPEKEKLVIATPFSKKGQFYLNYKENCFVARGEAHFGGECLTFAEDAYALLDWGRGVWPYSHEWYWGNGSTKANGCFFGFNIGWGFGDTRKATENMFFYNNKAYKLGQVFSTVLSDGATRYRDEDGRFDFIATPVFDNFTATKLLIVNNICHQVFGRWNGSVILDTGEAIKVMNMTAFLEHSVNHW